VRTTKVEWPSQVIARVDISRSYRTRTMQDPEVTTTTTTTAPTRNPEPL